MKRCTFFTFKAIALCILFGTQPALAGLGFNENSIDSDQNSLNGSSHEISNKDNCRVHTLKVENGTTVKEYASYNGVVFAVSWKGGMAPPDLSQLLGKHYAEFQSQTLPPMRGRRLASITTDHIVVELGGHMRSVQGRAWVPDLLPPGMSSNDIQ